MEYIWVRKINIKLVLITIVGGILRFWNLGENPLWTDEAFFGFLSFDSEITQEFIPAYFVKLFNLRSDFGLRFLSALCGTLTIPAIYLVVKKYKLYASFLIAVFPIFIFWSKMARPYSVSGLMMVLSWRWWYMMIPAILTSPIALIGIINHKWKVILGFLIIGLIIYLIREDSGRAWTIEQVLNSPRWFYLPFLTVILFIFDRFIPYLDRLAISGGKVLGLQEYGLDRLFHKRNNANVVCGKGNKKPKSRKYERGRSKVK